jgi:hypothetical protein
MIQKVKHKLGQKKLVSVRSLAKEYGMSKSSAHRILKEDVELYPYKMIIKLKLTNEHKIKQKKVANWIFNDFRKEDTMRILFSDEKCSISTAYTVPKISVFGRPVVLKQMKEVALK